MSDLYGNFIPKIRFVGLPTKAGFSKCVMEIILLNSVLCISRVPLTRGGGWRGFKGFEGVLIYISDF